MQLGQQIIRYCQIMNIVPIENKDGKLEYLSIFEQSYKKGHLTIEQYKILQNVLNEDIA